MAYSQTKIAAVMADLALGTSQRQAARRHGVSHTTIKKWAAKFPELAHKKDLGDLLVEHLENEIRTLDAIAEHARDKTWLKEQSAGELGTFYGIVSDKVHRVAAAVERARQIADGEG